MINHSICKERLECAPIHILTFLCNLLQRISFVRIILTSDCSKADKIGIKYHSQAPKRKQTRHYITSFVLPETSWYTERRLLHSGLSGLSNSRLYELQKGKHMQTRHCKTPCSRNILVKNKLRTRKTFN